MTTYRQYLGLITPQEGNAGFITGPPAASFSLLYELSGPAYDALVAANQALGQYRQKLSFLNLVEWNAQDYFDLQEHLLVEGLASKGPFTRSPELDVNRRLMNLLSSARSYLDHTETDLKRRFGDSGPQVRQFEELTSRLYDRYFSYRFLYRFRNFVQHCGLPLDSVSHSSHLGSKTFRATVSRDRLLTGFEWGPLRQEVAALPEAVDLNELLTEYVHLLETLHERLCADEVPSLQQAAGVVLGAAARLVGRRGVPSVFTVPDGPLQPSAGPSSMESLQLTHSPLFVAVAQLILQQFPPRPPQEPGA